MIGVTQLLNTKLIKSQDILMNFLIQAGGGGGGQTSGSGIRSAGGGAGGLLSSVTNSGGGAEALSPIILTPGDTVNVYVGQGGATNNNGQDSYISSSSGNFQTLTAIGGGKGGGYGSGAPGNGGCGGGHYTSPAGSGTTGQGFDGGIGNNTGNSSPYLGGGGGGTGSAGNTDGNGNGGDGTISTIITTSKATQYNVGEVSGSDVYFGGGGGGYDQIGSNSLSIGLGGGASLHGGSIQRDPLPNSGGAGAASDTSTGRSQCQGAAGVVILKVPTDNYTSQVSGNPIVYTANNDTVMIFKTNGSYTA